MENEATIPVVKRSAAVGRHFRRGRIAIYAVLAIYTLWILAPFVIILVTSFTTTGSVPPRSR